MEETLHSHVLWDIYLMYVLSDKSFTQFNLIVCFEISVNYGLNFNLTKSKNVMHEKNKFNEQTLGIQLKKDS